MHLENGGVFITTPKVSNDLATVHVQSTVVNQTGLARKITVQTTLIAPDGQPVRTLETTQDVSAGKPVTFQQEMPIQNPQIWDIQHPNLYRASVRILAGKAIIDDDIVQFGIREFHFDAATGFG